MQINVNDVNFFFHTHNRCSATGLYREFDGSFADDIGSVAFAAFAEFHYPHLPSEIQCLRWIRKHDRQLTRNQLLKIASAMAKA